MTPERWERVGVVFATLQDRPAPERPALLQRLCGDDAELASQVAALLSSAAAAGSFLSAPPSGSSLAAAVPTAEAPAWTPGTVLAGRYQILRHLGAGGMGEVYAAHDRLLDAAIALKRVRGPMAADPRSLARLKRELLLARRVSHPNVCRIHDWTSTTADSGAPEHFLTMELLEGETLAAWLQREGPAPELIARRWLAEVACGLDAAHAAGVIHRDLKPGNIMLTGPAGAQRAAITDFGLAAASDPEPAASASRLLGTLAYMAPEQLAGVPVTAACDVYAFGLVAHETLTGRPAFAGTGPFGGLLPRLQGQPAPPSATVPELGTIWDAALAACLAEDPALRPPSASAALALVPAHHLPAPVPQPRPRHLGRWAVLGLGSLALVSLGATALRWLQVRSQVPPGAAILLTPLVNATQQPQFDGASAALRQQLAQSAHFELLDDARMHQTLARMAQPVSLTPAALAQRPALARELAMRADAPLVIFGTLTQVAGRYRLELELERVGHDPDAPARRWTDAESADDAAGVFDALHAAANWVRRLAGEPEADLASTDQPPQDITTPSWEALALFARAERERATGRTPQALALLRQAVTLDPGFALADTRLADILVEQREFGEAYTDYRLALRQAQGSRRLSQREWFRLQGSFDTDLGDNAGAVQAYQAYAALYPNDYLGWFYQGLPDMRLGQPALAFAAWQRAEQLAPASPYPAHAIAQGELIQGRFDAASQAARRLRQTGNLDLTNEIEGAIAAARGDNATAQQRFAALARTQDPYQHLYAYLLQADLAAEQGQYRRARADLLAGLPAAQALGPGAGDDLHVDLAYLDGKVGDRSGVLAECETAVADHASLPAQLAAGTLLARAGFTQPTQRLAAAAAHASALQPLAGLVAERLRAEVLLADGHAQAALPLVQDAARRQGALEDREFLAYALQRAHQPRAALQVYLDWTRNPGTIWWWAPADFPGRVADLTFQAAHLSQQLGLPAAGALWQQYLHLRAHADPGLPEVTYARSIAKP